ncbi:alanine-zipper protein [Pseudomonas sp. TAF7]|uniref:alanine-zipper protein n=1 Tax=Pseudomonas sp. TAF7 TaxID=3233073 RepID=UPI003F997062
MDFDYRYLIALVFATAAFCEALTIRRLLHKLNDKVDQLDAIVVNLESQVADAAHEASSAKQVALNAWDDAKKRHADVISAVENVRDSGIL